MNRRPDAGPFVQGDHIGVLASKTQETVDERAERSRKLDEFLGLAQKAIGYTVTDTRSAKDWSPEALK